MSKNNISFKNRIRTVIEKYNFFKNNNKNIDLLKNTFDLEIEL